MTIRIIAVEHNYGAAANVGGPSHVTHKTFDVEAPELEAFLKPRPGDSYSERSVVGVEVLKEQTP